MVIDTFENAARYYMLHPAIEMVLDYMENLDPVDFKPGRVELSGSDVFVNAMEQLTLSEEEAVWESHEQHIDIHYMMEGHELIKFAEEYKMDVEVPYDKEKDCTLFTGDAGMEVNHIKGGFVIFFPEEIHKAMITDGIPSKVKKLVGKIKVD